MMRLRWLPLLLSWVVLVSSCRPDSLFWRSDHFLVEGRLREDGTCLVTIEGRIAADERTIQQLVGGMSSNVGLPPNMDLQMIMCGAVAFSLVVPKDSAPHPGVYSLTAADNLPPPPASVVLATELIPPKALPFTSTDVTLQGFDGALTISRVLSGRVVGTFTFHARRRAHAFLT